MQRREHRLTPSQQATNGALDNFVDGCRKDDVRQQLLGLSVLQSATEAQIHAALRFTLSNRHLTPAEVRTKFSS